MPKVPKPPPFNDEKVREKAAQAAMIQKALLAQRRGFQSLVRTSPTGLSPKV